VRREDDLDGLLEQREQSLYDLLARHAVGQPLNRDLEARAAVDERVARDDGSAAGDPEHGVERLLPPRKGLDPDG
jgi:hypothetical protein